MTLDCKAGDVIEMQKPYEEFNLIFDEFHGWRIADEEFEIIPCSAVLGKVTCDVAETSAKIWMQGYRSGLECGEADGKWKAQRDMRSALGFPVGFSPD